MSLCICYLINFLVSLISLELAPISRQQGKSSQRPNSQLREALHVARPVLLAWE